MPLLSSFFLIRKVTKALIFISKKQISRYFKLSLIIIISQLSRENLYGQKFLTDTLYVNFKSDTLANTYPLCIKTIRDQRDEDPDFVMYQTKNKFLLFPVDQEIHLTKSLVEAIHESILPSDSCTLSYTMHINRFEIEKRKGRFASSTFLIADIPVYENRNDSLYYYGTLYYDHQYQPINKKESLTVSTENILQSWHRVFINDMIKISKPELRTSPEISPGFITDPSIRPLLMNVQTGFFGGRSWYGFQGEIFFSRPETNNNNKYLSGIIRYQNNTDYESIAIGRNSEHFSFRRNKNLVFDIDMNILLGFLKWKNIDANKPTVYQIVNIELSSVQSIVYGRQNRQGFYARLGVIETLGYIYDRKLRFQIGGFTGLGYKF